MSQHRPRKRFGQHFLTDPTAIDEIMQLVDTQADATVIEIGPGFGILTDPLLERCKTLIAVEIDRDLATHLRRRFAEQPKFSLIEADALKLQLNEITADRVTIIGNLPYNISTPLLFHLFEQRQQIDSMLFMLQKEVVERMAAHPGSKRYGRLSVMTQYYCEVEPLIEIPPTAFEPPPKVDSQMVRLYPKPFDKSDHRLQQQLSTLVTAAFAHRRKTLRNTLSGLCTADTIIAAGCDPAARAETLSLNEFITLAGEIETHRD
ncbi:MAG: 16S rRNA (adenine(1518)-N(6)/adenine(1519)-N(6))-dimethyltransferase RsmA [Rhodobacteraceae bacterium]|nr:16S rRNA (adenine(1518)-N(6)/adenine(1519)-N(6))-dimethyltransferase RsmA [Paracoccaceae bacterium]